MKDFFKGWFDLRGTLGKKPTLAISITGILVILFSWYIVTSNEWVEPALLPHPGNVLGSFSELHFDDFLVRNAFYSIKLNYWGDISKPFSMLCP